MDSSAPPSRFDLRWRSLGAVALVGAGLAAYANTFSVPFLLDDTASILENPSIRHLWPLNDVLTPPEDAGVGGRPFANLSFAFNYVWGGSNVQGYHLINLAIHVAAALVLFGLVWRTLGRPVLAARIREDRRAPLAWCVALIWLLHPLQTEAVTYISQRTESLMGLCYLLTLYGFVRRAETGGRGWLVLAVVACTCGMATKEVMVTAPVVVWLFDRTFFAGSFLAAWRTRRWFYLALAGTWLVLVFHLSGLSHRGVTYETLTGWEYARIECGALLRYLQLAVWPAPLVFDYGRALATTTASTWASAVIIATLLVAVVLALWRRPLLGLAGAWFFVLLAPTSSFIPLAGQPIAEHRMYLPLAGLIAGVAIAACGRWGRSALVGLGALAAMAGFVTHQRNSDYRTAEVMWRDTTAKHPTNARAHGALGEALLGENKYPAAIAELEAALRLDPNDAKVHNNLAAALQETGRPAEAVAHYRASARLEPNVASTHYNLGNALLALGHPAEAIASLQRATTLAPNLAVAHGGLANALAAAGRASEALPHYLAALRLDPALAPVHFALANLLANSGRFAEAVPHYEATLLAYPDSPEAHFNFGTTLALTGRTAEAIKHFEITLRLKPDFPGARENLAKLREMGSPVAKP